MGRSLQGARLILGLRLYTEARMLKETEGVEQKFRVKESYEEMQK